MAFRFPLEALRKLRQSEERQHELLLQDANQRVPVKHQNVAYGVGHHQLRGPCDRPRRCRGNHRVVHMIADVLHVDVETVSDRVQ